MTASATPASLELQRQQRLLQSLWQVAPDVPPEPPLSAWLADTPERQARGLRAYRGNARATAARALAVAFPTVAALLGDETFNAVAAGHWQSHPPSCGDLAQFGADFASALGADAQLADLPYLADVARLDWAVHRCAGAADPPTEVAGLALLAEADPAGLRLRFCPGLGLLRSAWPLVSIWLAHPLPDHCASTTDRAALMAVARQALARQQAETALVWRSGWRPQVQALDEAAADFTDALIVGAALAGALDRAGNAFDFEAWLISALRQGWIAAVVAMDGPVA